MEDGHPDANGPITLTEALRTFLLRPDLLNHEREWLKAVLTKPQERLDRTVIPSPEQLFAKMGYIQQIFFLYTSPSNVGESGIRPFFLWHLSNLSFMPQNELQELSNDINAINAFINDVYPFVCQVLRGRTVVPIDLVRPNVKGVAAPRNTKQPDVLRRDNFKCLLTSKIMSLEVCHIIPYSGFATTTDERALERRWHIAKRMFGSQRADELERMLKGPGCTEFTWNLITLCRCIHHAWDLDHIGLEPVEISGTKTIRIRVQWFINPLAEKYAYLQDANATFEEINAMVQPLFQSVNVSDDHEVNIETGKPVLTGNVYTICRTNGIERSLMYRALQARWDLQRVMFCAGASGISTDDFVMPPEDEDSFRRILVEFSRHRQNM